MSSPKKENEEIQHNPVKEEVVKAAVADGGRRSCGVSMGSMDKASYKQLQCMAKALGLPCNLKKETLRLIIIARINGKEEEVNRLLKYVRESRLLRKLQKEGAPKDSSAVVKSSNDSVPRLESVEGKMKKNNKNKVDELLRKMLEMKSTANVTIKKTSLLAQYRLKPSNGAAFNNSFGQSIAAQHISTAIHGNRTGYFVRRRQPHTVTSQSFHETVTQDASNAVMTAQCNRYSYPLDPNTSKRDPLYHQFAGNDFFTSTPRRNNYPSNPTTALSYYPPPLLGHPEQSNNSRTTGYQVPAQMDIRYGGYPHGAQQALPFYKKDDYMGTQNNYNANMTALETSFERQQTNSIHNRQASNTVLHQNELPMFGRAFPNKGIPEIDLTDLEDPSLLDTEIDVTGLDHDDSTLVDSGLGDMPIKKDCDGTPNQLTNDNLLMVAESSTLAKDHPCFSAPDVKPLMKNLPLWTNYPNSSPFDLPNNMAEKGVALCKFGCHTLSVTKKLQIDHEQSCIMQPIQCPMVNCRYANQLGSISTHLLTAHNNDIKCNESAAFYLDFTDGSCSFEQSHSQLKNCPKMLRFCQLVDRRIFIITAIGNFDSMQVVVYAQYIDDFYNLRSHIVFEVVRSDGLPLAYSGDVLPITYSSLNIITRRKCLVFNMNSRDHSQNLFILHTRVHNQP